MKNKLKEIRSKNEGSFRSEDYIDLLDLYTYRKWVDGIYDISFVEGEDEFYRDLMEDRMDRTGTRSSINQIPIKK